MSMGRAYRMYPENGCGDLLAGWRFSGGAGGGKPLFDVELPVCGARRSDRFPKPNSRAGSGWKAPPSQADKVRKDESLDLNPTAASIREGNHLLVVLPENGGSIRALFS
jgi:hypothetical protein